MGIETDAQMNTLVSETWSLVARHVEASEADPMAFITNPPKAESNTDAVAITVASTELGFIAQHVGHMVIPEGGKH
ncbi:hypothetical protein [Halomonas halophila]